jgi:hypothetical protein
MRLSNNERADDPLGRFREGWRLKAQNARNAWLPGRLPIETALEGTFREGVTFAAELLEKEGHRELALKVRMQAQPKV